MGCHFLLQCVKVKSKVKSLSRVRLLATPWTAAHQAPPSMGFSRQEYWSGLQLLSPVVGIRRGHFCGVWGPATGKARLSTGINCAQSRGHQGAPLHPEPAVPSWTRLANLADSCQPHSPLRSTYPSPPLTQAWVPRWALWESSPTPGVCLPRGRVLGSGNLSRMSGK